MVTLRADTPLAITVSAVAYVSFKGEMSYSQKIRIDQELSSEKKREHLRIDKVNAKIVCNEQNRKYNF